MSHFTVLVIGKNQENQLEKFDENLEVERYVRYTKQQLIDRAKKYREDYKNTTYAEYLADPAKYALECRNEGHLNYVREVFPKELLMSDEELYLKEVSDYEDIGENGEVYSTLNPNAKWDWYEEGGRWAGYFKTADGPKDQTTKGEVLFAQMREEAIADAEKEWMKANVIFAGIPVNETWDEIKARCKFPTEARDLYWSQPRCVAWKQSDAINQFSWDASPDDYLMPLNEFCQNAANQVCVPFALVKDGEWQQKGEMGWFGCSTDEMTQAEWNKKVTEILDALPDDELLTLIDCHI
jgi:hypothetical protein